MLYCRRLARRQGGGARHTPRHRLRRSPARWADCETPIPLAVGSATWPRNRLASASSVSRESPFDATNR
eukprot:scaffold7878_cov126-Isochrysis_galbana.AAC.14